MNEWMNENARILSAFETDWEPALSNTLCKQIKPLSEVKPEMVR